MHSGAEHAVTAVTSTGVSGGVTAAACKAWWTVDVQSDHGSISMQPTAQQLLAAGVLLLLLLLMLLLLLLLQRVAVISDCNTQKLT